MIQNISVLLQCTPPLVPSTHSLTLTNGTWGHGSELAGQVGGSETQGWMAQADVERGSWDSPPCPPLTQMRHGRTQGLQSLGQAAAQSPLSSQSWASDPGGGIHGQLHRGGRGNTCQPAWDGKADR